MKFFDIFAYNSSNQDCLRCQTGGVSNERLIFLEKSTKKSFFFPKICSIQKKTVPLCDFYVHVSHIHPHMHGEEIRKIRYRKEDIMTKKRRMKLESELASLLDVEKSLTGQGKQLSIAFHAMKNRVLRELEAA